MTDPDKKTDLTRTFKVKDASGAVQEVYEYTTSNRSFAGGKERWYPGDKHYTTPTGEGVGHRGHKEFQLPGSPGWLPEHREGGG